MSGRRISHITAPESPMVTDRNRVPGFSRQARRARASAERPLEKKATTRLTYVHNGVQSSRSIARQHILDPLLSSPPRTICGVQLLDAGWVHQSKVHGKVCGNCDRMRGSALERLASVR